MNRIVALRSEVLDRVGGVSRFTWAVVAITSLALVLRLWAVHRFGDVVGFRNGDQAQYQALARLLGEGDGYAGFYQRVPGYPIFLAVILEARDRLGWGLGDRAAVGLVQACLGTATATLTAVLGRRHCGRAVGVIAGLTIAVWPGLILMTPVFMTETLFTAVVAAAVTLVFWDADPHPRRLAGGGLLLGSAWLVRPAVAPVLVVLVLWLVCRVRPWPASGRAAVALLGGAALVVFPWIARNALDYGVLLPGDTTSSLVLCLGNHPGVDPTANELDACRQLPSESVLEADRRLRSETMAWMLGNLSEQPHLIVERGRALWDDDSAAIAELSSSEGADPEFSDETRDLLIDLSSGFWYVARTVGAIGVVVMLIRRDTRWLAAAYLALLTGPILAFSTSRYHQPVAPLMALGVGVAVTSGWALLARLQSAGWRASATKVHRSLPNHR